MNRRRWLLVVAAASVLAVTSLASNVTSASQLSGDANTFLAVRLTLSKLLNSGTAWAGLAVLCGCLVRRAPQAAVAGVVASVLALAVHYGLGRLIGQFSADIWASNGLWFVASIVVSPLLGLIGAAGRRADRLGLAARLVVPAGAILEPFVLGMFSAPAAIPWPDHVSSVVCGVILIVTAMVGALIIVVTARRRAGLAPLAAPERVAG